MHRDQSDQGILFLGVFYSPLQSISVITEPVLHTCGGRRTDTTEELSVKARRGCSHTTNMHMCTDQFIAGYQGSVHWKSQLPNYGAPNPPGLFQGTNCILFCRNCHSPRPTFSHAVIPNLIWGLTGWYYQARHHGPQPIYQGALRLLLCRVR